MILKYYGGTVEEMLARWAPVYRRVFELSRRIVVASRFVGRAIEAQGFATLRIPHLIFAEDWRPRLRTALRPRFLCVRGFHPMYNPLMIVRAFERIRSQRQDAELTMIGFGALLDDTRAYTRDRDLPVRFLQKLSQRELADEMHDHDVFLNASSFDNQPVCILECMLNGLPVITTDVGGIPELFRDGEVGYFVGENRDDQMADRALALLADPAAAAAMSRRGAERGKAHLWSSLRRSWAGVVGDAVARFGGHPGFVPLDRAQDETQDDAGDLVAAGGGPEKR
jgi:glycosyltransferase involved in cell wall biosynthesis